MSRNLDEQIAELVATAMIEGHPGWLHNRENLRGAAGVVDEAREHPRQVLYSGPYFDESELIAGVKSFLTGDWLVSGAQVEEFQRAFSERFGVRGSLMVNSGSSANLALIAAARRFFDWSDGDEIIVSPVGFPTTISPIVHNGLIPAFADIEWSTLNFSLAAVEAAVTPRTRAILVSPVLGNPPDMDGLSGLAATKGLALLGDNCDSLGTLWSGRPLSDHYAAWSCSFYPAHHITTGEGGMVSSNEAAIIDIARKLAWWGRDCHCVGTQNLDPDGDCAHRFDTWLDGYDGIIDHRYLFSEMGYNLKPLDLQGAIGLEQLRKFPDIDRRRRRNKDRWVDVLTRRAPSVRVASSHPQADPSWFGVPIICETAETKASLQGHLEANRIQTRNYFAGNILLHPGYKHLGDHRDYPEAGRALSHAFFVGCPPHYTDGTFDYIEEVLAAWTG